MTENLVIIKLLFLQVKFTWNLTRKTNQLEYIYPDVASVTKSIYFEMSKYFK